MKSKTAKITKEFTQINREYIFTSAELRKLLGLEGELKHMGLQSGRSPNDVEEGKSAEKDRWYITTEEIKSKSEPTYIGQSPYTLKQCKKCNQMTNHLKGICQKCKG